MEHEPRGAGARPGTLGAHLLAGLMCAIALGFAAGWALVLPIFLSPDEDSHYDYALTLFTAGRPLRPGENVAGRDTHPTVAYLMNAAHVRQQRLDTAVGADPGYGTPAYFRALDAGAPRIDVRTFRAGPIEPEPYISRVYPIGYYALAAMAIAAGDRLTHGSATGDFFFARFLSVALLASTLLFSWLALRELGLGTRRALLLFLCTALLPMTAWMGGYVQPDNLACALVAPIVYLALRLRARPAATGTLAVTGILLAGLVATKQQDFLATYVPLIAMLAVRLPFRPSRATLKAVVLLTLPALTAFALTRPFLEAAPGGGGVCALPSRLTAARLLGPSHVLRYYASGVKTMSESFAPGNGVDSFWLAYTAYRNSFLTLGTPGVTQVILAVLAPVSGLVAALFCVRLLLVARRLVLLTRRRSWRSAARVATGNVLINAYLCYFAIVLAFEVSIGGVIPIQGRYWMPFLPAVWLAAVTIAPRALPRRYARALSTLLLAAIVGFDVLASLFVFPSLRERFYRPPLAVPPRSEVLADVNPHRDGRDLIFSGAAMDLRDAAPVLRVVVRLDGRKELAARRVMRPDIECNMEGTLLRSGFEARILAASLSTGPHTVDVLVVTPWSAGLVDTGAYATFRSTAGDRYVL